MTQQTALHRREHSEEEVLWLSMVSPRRPLHYTFTSSHIGYFAGRLRKVNARVEPEIVAKRIRNMNTQESAAQEYESHRPRDRQ